MCNMEKQHTHLKADTYFNNLLLCTWAMLSWSIKEKAKYKTLETNQIEPLCKALVWEELCQPPHQLKRLVHSCSKIWQGKRRRKKQEAS